MEKQKTKEELCVENLKSLKEIFNANSINFWLDWGTLLGAVREHKLIPWDLDVDFGVLSGDYNKIIAAASQIKKAGFLMNEVSIPIANSEFIYRRFGFYRSGYPIDMGVYYPENENVFSILGPGKFRGKLIRFLWLVWFSLMSKHVSSDSKYNTAALGSITFFLELTPSKVKNKLAKILKKEILKRNYGAPMRKVVISKHYFENLDKMEFYGEKFNIPSNVEDYLTLKYGADWKTPKKDAPSWDTKANI